MGRTSLSERACLRLLVAGVALLAACGNKESDAPAAVSAPRAVAAVLDASVSRQQLESGPLEPSCSVEGVLGIADQNRFAADASATYAVPRGAAVKVIGFGTRYSTGKAMGSFTAYLAGTQAVYKVSGQTTLERLDVVKYFNAPNMLASGFQLDVDLKGVPPGDYAVMLRPDDGPVCPTHHTLRIQ